MASQTKETFTCVNLTGVPDRPKPPGGFQYCGICRAWHDVRWHQAVWRRKAYEEQRELVAVYREGDV